VRACVRACARARAHIICLNVSASIVLQNVKNYKNLYHYKLRQKTRLRPLMFFLLSVRLKFNLSPPMHVYAMPSTIVGLDLLHLVVIATMEAVAATDKALQLGTAPIVVGRTPPGGSDVTLTRSAIASPLIIADVT